MTTAAEQGGPGLPSADKVATAWARAVADTSVVSMSRRALVTFLLGLAAEVLQLLAQDEPDPARARELGRALVTAHLTEVDALQRTLVVLHDQLAAGSRQQGGGGGIGTVLAGLAAGYAQALQERTRHEQEQISASAFAARVAAEARFEAMFAGAGIGIAICDPIGGILQVNPCLCELLGYEAAELTALPFWSFVHPKDGPGIWEEVKELVAGAVDHLKMEKPYYRKDGAEIWTNLVLSLVRDPGGEPRYVVAMMESITERHHLQTRLHHEAMHDPLTGLPNRTLFFERLDAALCVPDPEHGVGVCYLDLDGFKAINDTLGHDTGDVLLRAVAQRLTSALGRHGHLVARMGGDEFVVLVENSAGLEHLQRVAQSALDTVRLPVLLDGREISISASVGVVQHDGGGTGSAELMKAADTTMYWAKTGGRDRYAVFDAERHRTDVSRFLLAARMPEALARREFVVDYQPLVQLDDQQMIGVEALVRWQLPNGDRLGPAEFVPLAEETGLIVPLGRAVLTEACRQAVRWTAAVPGTALLMSVNLAARQVREPGLVEDVRRILAETGWRPELLQLELTESDLMGTTEGSLTALRSLAAMGVRIAIDDFGTGYSNLAYLRDLPVHALKLAGPFVTGGLGASGQSNEVDEQVLALLVQLAHTLGLSVTAESVETPAQLQRLAELGCDIAQGWYFAPALRPELIPELVRSPTWPGGAAPGRA